MQSEPDIKKKLCIWLLKSRSDSECATSAPIKNPRTEKIREENMSYLMLSVKTVIGQKKQTVSSLR